MDTHGADLMGLARVFLRVWEFMLDWEWQGGDQAREKQGASREHMGRMYNWGSGIG